MNSCMGGVSPTHPNGGQLGWQWGGDVGGWSAGPAPDPGEGANHGLGWCWGRGCKTLGPQLGELASAVCVIVTGHSGHSLVPSLGFYIFRYFFAF